MATGLGGLKAPLGKNFVTLRGFNSQIPILLLIFAFAIDLITIRRIRLTPTLLRPSAALTALFYGLLLISIRRRWIVSRFVFLFTYFSPISSASMS